MTSPRMSLVRSRQFPGLRVICDVSNFGLTSYTTAALPDRVYTGLDAAERSPSIALLEADLGHHAPPHALGVIALL